MRRRFIRRVQNMTALFQGKDYLDVRVLYAIYFGEVPCVTHIDDLNTTKALIYLKDTYAHEMMGRFHSGYFDHAESSVQFYNIILLLSNKRIIDIGHNYIQVLHTMQQAEQTGKMMKCLADFKLAKNDIRPSIGFVRPSDN